MKCLLALLNAAAISVSGGNAIWVDQQSGDDAAIGTREAPLRSVDAGLARVRPGGELHLVPGERPWPGDIRITVSGTAEQPIVVDGHGSVVSGRGQLPAAAWKAESGDVFSRKLPNNAWGMERHWEGGFPLVWFEGLEGENVTNRSELKPLSYFLHKNRKAQKTDPLHNTLFVKLPVEKTPRDVRIETIVGEGGIFVGGSHVIVRNFVTEYGGRDGFATHRNTGVVFEHIEARQFMDQGMSHHGSEVTIRNAHFHHNAGCGVVDVYPECRTRYENCLIEADTWRGGVEFHKGEFEMVNCRIRGNAEKALTVAKGARVTLRDCVLSGPAGALADGVTVGEGCRLILVNCTLRGFETAMIATLTATTRLELRNCVFEACDTNLRLNFRRGQGEAEPEVDEVIRAAGIWFKGGGFTVIDRRQDDAGKWRVSERRIDFAERAAFGTEFGIGIAKAPVGARNETR